MKFKGKKINREYSDSVTLQIEDIKVLDEEDFAKRSKVTKYAINFANSLHSPEDLARIDNFSSVICYEIKEIDFSDNQFITTSKNSFIKVGDFISRCINLETLKINNCGLLIDSVVNNLLQTLEKLT